MTGTDAAKPVGIYARVSTVEQIEGTSLVLQIDRCRQYAAAMGWQVAGEYVDEGVSGAKASRPALDEMMGDARAGLLQAVVAAKLDRVGRSMRHLVSLMGECDDLGVAVVSVAEGFDSTTPAGRLQRNILGSFAEFERDQIRERTMGGSEAAARQGRWVGVRRRSATVSPAPAVTPASRSTRSGSGPSGESRSFSSLSASPAPRSPKSWSGRVCDHATPGAGPAGWCEDFCERRSPCRVLGPTAAPAATPVAPRSR